MPVCSAAARSLTIGLGFIRRVLRCLAVPAVLRGAFSCAVCLAGTGSRRASLRRGRSHRLLGIHGPVGRRPSLSLRRSHGLLGVHGPVGRRSSLRWGCSHRLLGIHGPVGCRSSRSRRYLSGLTGPGRLISRRALCLAGNGRRVG